MSYAANAQRMLDDLPSMAGLSLNEFVKHLDFGPAACGPMDTALLGFKSTSYVPGNVMQLVESSVDGVRSMRGQRGERLVTEMMTSWCTQGLWMHGGPDSVVNRMVIPAAHHIFATMASLPSKNTKRVDVLTTLALACQDCQQVQAREIMRIFGDLTSQNASLEQQLKYSLVREKETAINCLISQKHPGCDLDHTRVQPWQQRVHLFSGYVSLVGEKFGLDSVTTAKSDRFLGQALVEIGTLDVETVLSDLRSSMCVKNWLQLLLADVNNQSESADRLLDRSCIFNWVQANMSDEDAHLVFFDSDRAAEFADQEPVCPETVNQFQPFLSWKVLVQILLGAGMLTWT